MSQTAVNTTLVPPDPSLPQVVDLKKGLLLADRLGKNTIQFDRETTARVAAFYDDNKTAEQLIRNTDGSTMLLRKVHGGVKVLGPEFELCEYQYAPAGVEMDLLQKIPAVLAVRKKGTEMMWPFAFFPERNLGLEPDEGQLEALADKPMFKDLCELQARAEKYTANLHKQLADQCKIRTWILDKAEDDSKGQRTVMKFKAARQYTRESTSLAVMFEHLVDSVLHDLLEIDERSGSAYGSLDQISEHQLVTDKMTLPKLRNKGQNPSMVSILLVMKDFCQQLKVPQHLTHPLIILPRDAGHFREFGYDCTSPYVLLTRLTQGRTDCECALIDPPLIGADYQVFFVRVKVLDGATESGQAILIDAVVCFLMIPTIINTLLRKTERLGVGAMQCLYAGARSQISQIIGISFAYDQHLPIVINDSLGDLLGVISSSFTPAFPPRTAKTQITRAERFAIAHSNVTEAVQAEVQRHNNKLVKESEERAIQLAKNAIINGPAVLPDDGDGAAGTDGGD